MRDDATRRDPSQRMFGCGEAPLRGYVRGRMSSSPNAQSSSHASKLLAATEALRLVKNDMIVGLGSGSTSTLFIEALGHSVQSGERTGIVGIPTSVPSERLARAVGITVIGFEEANTCDLTIDGADEFDPRLDLIKGLGAALLREKIVAQHSRRLVIIVDDSKRVSRLGQKAPLPVEVTQFGLPAHTRFLHALGCTPTLRERDGKPVVTDNGNFILDCRFADGISDPAALATTLAGRAGIVEHGLFLNLASSVIVAGTDGNVTTIDRPGGPVSPQIG